MDAITVELSSDHPGFNDPTYRERRNHIASIATDHQAGTPAPRIPYTDSERSTWKTVFEQLTQLFPTHACKEFVPVIREMGYSPDEIPQLADVSAFLEKRTGFRLEPVAGLVSARTFLTSLGRGVFCATQYIRHHSKPHYTPEPDVVHELMGHAPMLAIEDFANLSRKIGEGANHATDEQVQQLATLYWFTIEYGVLRQDGALKAYGAGLLSSFGELSHVVSGGARVLPFDPDIAKDHPYPITSYQPLLWEVQSIRQAFEVMDAFVGKFVR
jgi:phenylalanine-4-hydroxylase